MKQYAPWIIGAVVVLGGVVFVATGGTPGSDPESASDDDSAGAFVPAKVDDAPDKSAGADGASGEEANAPSAPAARDGAAAPKNGVANANANANAGEGEGAVADNAPRRRLFEGKSGQDGADSNSNPDKPPAVLPSQREITVAQKEIRDAFTDATQKKTMECIAGFVKKGKSFKGDVVIRLRVKHDAQAKDFTYDMNAIELAGTTNGRLSDFDDETYRCLWDGIGSVKAPQTPRVDEAFAGDDSLAIEVPYSIEVRGAENP